MRAVRTPDPSPLVYRGSRAGRTDVGAASAFEKLVGAFAHQRREDVTAVV